MNTKDIFSSQELVEKAKALFNEERSRQRLDGWFLIKEIMAQKEELYANLSPQLRASKLLVEAVSALPLRISKNAVFAGTQSDSFARSYALINPAFRVESFTGYCDPAAVFDDIEPNEEFTSERISRLREHYKKSDYFCALNKTYENAAEYTGEAVFFIEQVTGHVIPDFRYVLSMGIKQLQRDIAKRLSCEPNHKHADTYAAISEALNAVCILAKRYADIAGELRELTFGRDKLRFEHMEKTLRKVPEQGAETFYEAIQAFLLLWQVMCIEQAPNPFAFSVGGADRIFEPYRKAENLDRDTAAGLLCHMLVFFNVGDRSWAISQNILAGGRDTQGRDLGSAATYALLDAYYTMNLPQPILSVKLHKNTPDEFYRSLGRFFFTSGCLTPSLFNDDSMFSVLEKSGINCEDLPDYSIAGCQEPLIMGKDNGNTTNSWLNLAKILELTISGGESLVTGKKIDLPQKPYSAGDIFKNLRGLFYGNVEYYTKKMAIAANEASRAISLQPVPFLSAFMSGAETGVDMRDAREQGTAYNASGCLIHGLSVVADSFAAVDMLLDERPGDAQRLLDALKTNFAHDQELRQYLRRAPKYGNNIESVDAEACEIVRRVSSIVKAQRNYLGNPFRADWSTPTTHLMYGYWVGATPDGRLAREMLNYGVDPLRGDASNGLGFRILSALKLPYEVMNGGYASHFGIDPKYFTQSSYELKGMEFKTRIVSPLFFGGEEGRAEPFYLYVNVTTPEILRKVLENPKKYAPDGVYIMRIHGTFVNFLNLSPAIQEDIIARLDLKSTRY